MALEDHGGWPDLLDRLCRGEDLSALETEAILDITRLKAGQLLRASEVAQAIRDIYRLRYFKQVQVEAREVSDGVVLVIRVQEKPAIREVKIDGNKKVTTEDIKEVMHVKPFSILDMAKVRTTASKIEELYQEKGFFLADIETDIEDYAQNEVDVTFTIREGKKVLVKQIDIVGNENLKDGYIKNRL